MNGIIKTHSTRSLEDHLDEAYNGERRKQASGEHAKAATSKIYCRLI